LDRERLAQILRRRRAFGAVVLLEALGWLAFFLFGIALISAWVRLTPQWPAITTQPVKSSVAWELVVLSRPIVAARITVLSVFWALGFLWLRFTSVRFICCLLTVR
jgi:hypothetical protein